VTIERKISNKVRQGARKTAPNTSRRRAAKKEAEKSGQQVAETKQARKAVRRAAARRRQDSRAGNAGPSPRGAGKRLTPAMKRTRIGKKGRRAKDSLLSPSE
jgi:hypothetical protein